MYRRRSLPTALGAVSHCRPELLYLIARLTKALRFPVTCFFHKQSSSSAALGLLYRIQGVPKVF